jgi:hypothetical protein
MYVDAKTLELNNFTRIHSFYKVPHLGKKRKQNYSETVIYVLKNKLASKSKLNVILSANLLSCHCIFCMRLSISSSLHAISALKSWERIEFRVEIHTKVFSVLSIEQMLVIVEQNCEIRNSIRRWNESSELIHY